MNKNIWQFDQMLKCLIIIKIIVMSIITVGPIVYFGVGCLIYNTVYTYFLLISLLYK